MRTASYALAGFLAALSLLIPGTLKADTVYSYQGNPYTTCSPNYICTGSSPVLSIEFETSLSGAALDNLTDDDISSTLTFFDITDGAADLTKVNSSTPGLEDAKLSYPPWLTSSSTYQFIVDTNSIGQITAWLISADENSECNPPYCTADILFASAYSCYGLTESCPSTGLDDSLYLPSFGNLNGSGASLSSGTWASPVSTPEPSGLLLLSAGLLGLAGLCGRRRRLPRSI